MAPGGKLEPKQLEELIPTWYKEEEESGDQARERLAEKISTAFATLGGGQDPSGH